MLLKHEILFQISESQCNKNKLMGRRLILYQASGLLFIYINYLFNIFHRLKANLKYPLMTQYKNNYKQKDL